MELEIKPFLSRVTIAAIMLVVCGSPTSAEGFSMGQIYNLTVQDGIVMFYVTGEHSSPPPCATATTRWAFDGRSAAGQVIMTAISTAFATGKAAEIHGTGTCSVWGDSESIFFSIIH